MTSPLPATGPQSLLSPPIPRTTLVLGGARSGKSRFAESMLDGWADRRVYLATAEAGDAEMAERIRHHRERRGDSWDTVEEPLALPKALAREGGAAVLVDCLTLWLANLMQGGRDVEAATTALTAVLARRTAPAVLVSNEVGWGIVPDNPLARAFRDAAGRMNQAVAAAADRVVLVVAGLPLLLKDGKA
jgi:adenosyl cobinamide kinase/adenosyl cobinamide phosphate guanylyltransferase